MDHRHDSKVGTLLPACGHLFVVHEILAASECFMSTVVRQSTRLGGSCWRQRTYLRLWLRHLLLSQQPDRYTWRLSLLQRAWCCMLCTTLMWCLFCTVGTLKQAYVRMQTWDRSKISQYKSRRAGLWTRVCERKLAQRKLGSWGLSLSATTTRKLSFY